MKVLALAVIATMAASSVSAIAFDYSASNKSNWKIGGKIAKRCVVNTYDGGTRSTTLDLASTDAQATASVTLWCNTHSGTANATYSSVNGGYMENADGDQIAYLVDISGTQNDLDLSSPQTVSQVTGNGDPSMGGVGPQSRTVKVKPQVTGMEYAGVYRDRIRVKVTPK